MHLSTKKVHYDNPTIKHDSVKLPERVTNNNQQYIVGYVAHKLYSKFKFSKNKDCVCSKQCLSILLCCKINSDDTQDQQILKIEVDYGELMRLKIY